MKGIFVLLGSLFLILIVSCATTGISTGLPTITEYDKASNLFKQGQYEKAKDAYQKFLNNHHESLLCPSAQYYLAKCYQRQGDSETALKNYQEVCNKYPDSHWADLASHDIERIKSKEKIEEKNG